MAGINDRVSSTFKASYEIVDKIGSGGMSTVYLAVQKRSGTRWAVKEVSKRQNERIDFLTEAELLKNLDHPMLPLIVDIFDEPDFVYIVEEYVRGESLDKYAERQGPVDEETGLRWFHDLAGVLKYLHGQNPPVIYRDMKPSNIMLKPDGTLKLIDFGIARQYKREQTSDTVKAVSYGYAAPEQYGTAQTDARTDIYALGVTMYHLLTGKSPQTPPYGFPPARELNPALSAGMERALQGCIQPNPEDRFPDADALLAFLDSIPSYNLRVSSAYKKAKRGRKVRIAVLAVLLAASVGLIAGGGVLMGQEKEEEYASLLQQASDAAGDYSTCTELLDEARALYPDRVDPERLQTYALYLDGQWQECVDFGEETLSQFGDDTQTRLTMASAQFELGDYEAAAEGFAQGGDLSADNLRDYAVCLGRLGRIDEAEDVLSQLTGQGAHPDVTEYVQGEVSMAQKNWTDAETSFLSALDQAETDGLKRRCYISLGDLYRECEALARQEASPIANPATKAVQVLSEAVTLDALRSDSVILESLGLAYFESWHTDPNAPEEYLKRAAECFGRVIEMGVARDYLYGNLYTIYYEMKDYDQAEAALTDYMEAYPQSYVPHALRGILLISLENEKPQESRDYSAVMEEFNEAGRLLGADEDSSYYQQLSSYIDQLRSGGWIS